MKKTIISVLIILGFVGLSVLITNYQTTNTSNGSKSKTPKYFKVEKQNDLVLTGVVKSKSIKELPAIDLKDVEVNNGDHVNEGQVIYTTGYTAPISGTFMINSDESVSIVSDDKYIESSFTENNRSLIQQGQSVPVFSLDGSIRYGDSTLTNVGVVPLDNGDSVSKYTLMASGKNLPVGQHVKLYIEQKEVLIPKKYVHDGSVDIKKPNETQWNKVKVNVKNEGGLLYASINDVPVGSQLKGAK